VLGGRHSGRVANRPTFAGEPRRKRPRNRSGSLDRWVFGESQVLLRRENCRSFIGDGSRRLWPPRLRLLGRTCLRRCAPTRKRQRVSVVFATCRGPGCRSEKGRLCGSPSGARHAPRIACIVSRGLAPLAGKGRASARAATGDGCSTSVERPKPLGSGFSLVACHERASGAQAHDCPGFGTAWQGVSTAGRVRDCVVRARVFDCEDRQQRRPSRRSVGRASAMKK